MKKKLPLFLVMLFSITVFAQNQLQVSDEVVNTIFAGEETSRLEPESIAASETETESVQTSEAKSESEVEQALIIDDVMQDSTKRVEIASAEPTAFKSQIKPSLWVGMSLEVLSAGLFAYGIVENQNVKKHIKKADVERAARNRNIAYAVGTSFLLAGITIHITF